MASQVILTVIGGPEVGRKALFSSRRIRMGRGSRVDFSLDKDVYVSRNHALLFFKGDRLYIRRNKRKASVFIGAERIRKCCITSGTEFRLGPESLIRLELQESAETVPSPAWPPWCRNAMLVVAGCAVLALVALGLRKGCSTQSTVEQTIEGAITKRNTGDLETALTLIAPLALKAGPMSSQAESNYIAWIRLKKHFDAAHQLQNRLKLDAALDDWRLIQQSLSSNDPLRTWIQTHQIEPLEKTLRGI